MSYTTIDKQIDTRAASETFKAGIVACGPTILGYWSIGFAAGAIGALAGFSLLEITMLSALLYAGSAQFLFYSLYAAGAGVVPIVLSVFLINMRYALMASYMAMFFGGRGMFEKFIGGALLTDETFGVASQFAHQNGSIPFKWLLGLNVTAYVNWIFANLVGAVLASSMPRAITNGLGFSLTAMFVGLLLMTYFASRTKTLELVTITVATLIVVLGIGKIDPNMGILIATIVAALASMLMLRYRIGRRRTSK